MKNHVGDPKIHLKNIYDSVTVVTPEGEFNIVNYENQVVLTSLRQMTIIPRAGNSIEISAANL